MAEARHILVLRFSSMGDVAMTVPVLKAMLAQNQEAEVTFVSRPGFQAFFDGIDRLNYVPADLNHAYSGFAGILKLHNFLKQRARYHAVADLHNSLRSKILGNLFRLSGLPYKAIDKGRAGKKLLTRFPNKVLVPLKRTVERYADVFRGLGFQTDLDNKLIKRASPLPDDIKAITGEKDRPWIGISPFAQYRGKTYPIGNMDEVIGRLGVENVKVFLFGGGAADKETCGQWEEKYAHVTSVVGKLNMAQELVLINQLNVMLSMDSAGMHLASLRGTPVVSIWGATHHYAGFLGYGQQEDDIVADNIECRPCSVFGNKPCFRGDYACMFNIQPSTVVEKLLKFIV